MGTFGNRPLRNKGLNIEKEPPLLADYGQIIEFAKGEGLYTAHGLDIEKLIKMKFPDIRIEYQDFNDDAKSGSLYYDNGKWIIAVNKKHVYKRQKFTIAHELGHFLMHKDINTNFTDAVFFRNSRIDNMEHAANEFAANLLMPEGELRKCIDEENIKSIATLSELFGVSASAIAYRITKLGYKTRKNG